MRFRKLKLNWTLKDRIKNSNGNFEFIFKSQNPLKATLPTGNGLTWLQTLASLHLISNLVNKLFHSKLPQTVFYERLYVIRLAISTREVYFLWVSWKENKCLVTSGSDVWVWIYCWIMSHESTETTVDISEADCNLHRISFNFRMSGSMWQANFQRKLVNIIRKHFKQNPFYSSGMKSVSGGFEISTHSN